MTIDARHPLPGRRPLVVGAARSGVAAARLLVRHGLKVRLCDRRDASELPAAARALEDQGVECRFGSDAPALLEGCDFVVWSPGIPIRHPLAEAARTQGRAVLSELELGYLAAQARFVTITGTNGKSTATDLVGSLIRAAGREVEVCGNIGRPVCDVAESVGAAGLLAVEVSSFQLEAVDRLKPFIAAWLNLSPDHLDRHGDLETYASLKQRLFSRQDQDDYAVWNADDPAVTARRTGGGTWLEFSIERRVEQGAYREDGALLLAWRGGHERLMPAAELMLRGRHNLANVLAALAVTLPLEISPEVLRRTLRGYRGLEHRLESVSSVEGVEFVNDSKATNVGSLAVALESFARPVVLIAGGRDKGQDFTPLAGAVSRCVAHLVLIGEGADRIAAAWSRVPATRAASLAEAVENALEIARRVGAPTVLFSPGCASFDMFRDFEDRGLRFKAEVHKLKQDDARARA